jgi:hypothetical protein
MVAWVSLWVYRWAFMTRPKICPTDALTSKSSTFPYDFDAMQNMIRVVREAKSTPVCCKEDYH